MSLSSSMNGILEKFDPTWGMRSSNMGVST